MAHYNLPTPVSEEDIRKLRINDTVTLQNTLFGIRDATQIHMFDHGRKTRFDLNGHAVIHTAPNVRKVPVSKEFPAGYQPICIGTTTSDRMERFTRPLMTQNGVRMIVGKGGMREGSSEAFQDLGGVYLAIIGGTAALETTWIEQIEDVDMVTSILNHYGASKSKTLGLYWLRWIVMAEVFIKRSKGMWREIKMLF